MSLHGLAFACSINDGFIGSRRARLRRISIHVANHILTATNLAAKPRNINNRALICSAPQWPTRGWLAIPVSVAGLSRRGSAFPLAAKAVTSGNMHGQPTQLPPVKHSRSLDKGHPCPLGLYHETNLTLFTTHYPWHNPPLDPLSRPTSSAPPSPPHPRPTSHTRTHQDPPALPTTHSSCLRAPSEAADQP